jgi:hypothetical protein
VTERGSAMLLAMFVMVLLTGMGISLLFLSQSEASLGAADLGSKQAYYLAEAGVEVARLTLFNTNGNGPFDDDLLTHAGGDGVIDFDPGAARPVFDGQGQVTGFTGFDDDLPLIVATQLADGWFAAFLTNDPGEAAGFDSTNDTNDRVMITSVGAARDGSVEVVQAIVEAAPPFPGEIPATIMIFGPSPSFADVNNAAKVFQGDDCGGTGIPGFAVPVFGLMDTPTETVIEGSLGANTTYTHAGQSGDISVSDLTDATDPGVVASSLGLIDAGWDNCHALFQMTEEIRDVADVVCVEGVPCVLPPSSPGRVVFSDGDFSLNSSLSGAGLLWVTGTLTVDGATDWNGLIVVVGEGIFLRSGGGTGQISGATIVADIAGADDQYGTSDDCEGGTDGFDSAVYDESAGGTGLTTYCNADVLAATPLTKYAVVDFRQR